MTDAPDAPDAATAPGEDVGLDAAAVAGIPPSPGMSFRGGVSADWRVGEDYVEPGWLRTSRNPQIGTENFATDDVTVIFGRGRDLLGVSGDDDEQETVFEPGARFVVEAQGDVDGLWVTLVRVHRADDHPDPDPEPEIDARRAASVLVRSRSLPPARIEHPGRFVGGFGRPAPSPSPQ